jgi:hypothetical protein
MRPDETGMFWDDYVEPRVPVEKVKRLPPDPVWLADDYLPNLAEAQAYRFDLMSDAELLTAAAEKHRLAWDTEFYPNYALLGFKNITTGKIAKFEIEPWHSIGDEQNKLLWIARHFCLVGFNDTRFDVPMLHAVLAGLSTDTLMEAVEALIGTNNYGVGMSPREFYKHYKLKQFPIDNIDLIELTPLGPSLKISAGRMHAPRMADLPFPAGKVLSPEQIDILRWYWVNDLANTQLLYEKNKTAIELREILTREYKVDVRSKSDPQIAEAVIRAEIQRITKTRYLERAKIIPGRTFRYQPPDYLRYSTPAMQWVLDFVCGQHFVVDDLGSPMMPPELETLNVPIGDSVYQMGIGGLHSKEKKVIHVANEQWELTDNDVTSYYPSLILNQGMYPPNIGPVFLQVFKRIYDRRIIAKRQGDKATAETLKIVLNGTFGKTGERGGWSVVYYPEMMIQVTVTGQLSLLLLIEQLEMNGIPVVSANTDGIIIKCPRSRIALKRQIIEWWQSATGLELESTPYKAVYSRDINNYIALYEKPKDDADAFRYAKAIGTYRKTLDVFPLKWNPTCDICSEAVIAFLATGTPIEQTIRACTDVRKFIEVRQVRGGACKDGEYLGKAIRWYYATGEQGEIINAKNGHTVARSHGARPCMILPTELPADLDFESYVRRATDMLEDFTPKKKEEKAT